MAAHPLPENPILPVYIANAATAVEIIVAQGQIIEWQNHGSTDIPISVQHNSNGQYPLNTNSFSVPKAHVSIGTFQNNVLQVAQLGDYTFTRGATLGNGKIVVQPG